jgi:hypothetical protein
MHIHLYAYIYMICRYMYILHIQLCACTPGTAHGKHDYERSRHTNDSLKQKQNNPIWSNVVVMQCAGVLKWGYSMPSNRPKVDNVSIETNGFRDPSQFVRYCTSSLPGPEKATRLMALASLSSSRISTCERFWFLAGAPNLPGNGNANKH